MNAVVSRPRANVNAARLERRIADLAAVTDPQFPWSRTAFSPLHREGRVWLAREMASLGLSTAIDAGANLIGRLRGQRPELAPMATGSHSDTVPSGGRFDGAAGILVALEALHAMRDAGIELNHTLEIIDFLAEEPNQYGLSCIGSRALVGALTAADLQRTAPDGTTLSEGMASMGGDPDRLDMPLRTQGDLSVFVELHIEQGRVLESGGLDIGVVTDIVGIRRLEVRMMGRADHSGATPMIMRADALAGAAEIIVGFERRAEAEKLAPLVATVGKLNVIPNAANVVPGQVDFTLEVRAATEAAIIGYLADVTGEMQSIAERRGLKLATAMAGTNLPVKMSLMVQSAIAGAAEALGLRHQAMPSGAGHDAAFVARLCPVGMIFVPSKDGRSHCPEEYTSPSQLAAGAQVLLTTLLHLDTTLTRDTQLRNAQ